MRERSPGKRGARRRGVGRVILIKVRPGVTIAEQSVGKNQCASVVGRK